MKPITQKTKHNKTHRKKYIKKGGNIERIQKLRNVVELFLQFVYYRYFTPGVYKTVYVDLPENEWKLDDMFGMTIKQKKARDYTFEDYIANDIPEIPKMNRNQIISIINTISKYRGYAYQLLPIMLFSDEYMKEIDQTIENMVNQDKSDEIEGYFIQKLYLSKLLESDFQDANTSTYDFFSSIIQEKLQQLYNIPEI